MEKINFVATPEFNKDFKKLCKKYKTLPEDLEIVKKAAISIYHLNGIDNYSIFPIPGFCCEEVSAYKIKKFASRSFKGKGAKSGLRLIYLFFPRVRRVVFIEIYYKGVKPSEDKERLSNYYESYHKVLLKGEI